jgi:hypothetical protein
LEVVAIDTSRTPRAGATIAHSAKVVHCLVRAQRYFVAHVGNRRTYIEDSPVAKCAPGRIGIIDNQSEAFRAGRRATPGEWWRHVLAFACIDFWYTAIGWKAMYPPRANEYLGPERWQRQLLATGRGQLEALYF